MAEKHYEYIAQLFEPRPGAGRVLQFIAPAADISGWAGVPRKAFDYQHGFQRTLQVARIREVAEFFRKDPRNISPTSVVVGFIGQVEIEPIEAVQSPFSTAVRLRVKLEDLDALSLAELADRVLDALRIRLPDEVTQMIDGDLDTALAQAISLEDEVDVDESSSELTEVGAQAAEQSYLGDFYARLLGYSRESTPWPPENELREVLYSFLKPGIIVDGQHRVFGAALADENLLLSVCAIPDASWAESVYQFVVINQKAKPIKPAFLSSIIATSLNSSEIEAVYERLETSKIDVGRAELMERINTDSNSPFKGMIDFQVAGAPGFLQFPGIAALARDFESIPRQFPALLLNGTWSSAEGSWVEHFFAFWRGIRDYFESQDQRLWQRPSDANPNNLLKIVSLQEVQRLVLATWADSRDKKFETAATTEASAKAYWEDFPSSFFTDEWKKKGLQTSIGRAYLRNAIMETRRNIGRKNWGHRRLGLFLQE